MTIKILNRKLFFLMAAFLIFSKVGSSQLKAAYDINNYCSNCINVTLRNLSYDTIYLWDQSYSIQYWDSCFAYTVFKREYPKTGYDINITYYYRDMDARSSNTFYIFPDSTLNFGARSNEEITNDSLFISMYVYAMPVEKGESMEKMQRELQKLKRSRVMRPWQWRSFYCPRQQ